MNKDQLKERALELGITFPEDIQLISLKKLIKEKENKLIKKKKAKAEADLKAKKEQDPNLYEEIEGVWVKKDLPDAIKAVVVADKLKRKMQEEFDSKEQETNTKKSKEEYARQAAAVAEKVAKNNDILSYLDENDPMLLRSVRNRATRKIRVILNVFDPAKQQVAGAVLKTRNGVSGTVSEFVSYSEEPQHLHAITLKALEETYYNKFVPAYRINGQGLRVKTGTMTTKPARAFSFTILPHLTKEELEQLAKEQARTAMMQG